jgi:hypothetical protein
MINPKNQRKMKKLNLATLVAKNLIGTKKMVAASGTRNFLFVHIVLNFMDFTLTTLDKKGKNNLKPLFFLIISLL